MHADQITRDTCAFWKPWLNRGECRFCAEPQWCDDGSYADSSRVKEPGEWPRRYAGTAAQQRQCVRAAAQSEILVRQDAPQSQRTIRRQCTGPLGRRQAAGARARAPWAVGSQTALQRAMAAAQQEAHYARHRHRARRTRASSRPPARAQPRLPHPRGDRRDARLGSAAARRLPSRAPHDIRGPLCVPRRRLASFDCASESTLITARFVGPRRA